MANPDFDPPLKARYHARVIEIPTPGCTAYDAAYLDEAKFRTGGTDERHRTRLHVAHLVHAAGITIGSSALCGVSAWGQKRKWSLAT
jgi:hypothetical protein